MKQLLTQFKEWFSTLSIDEPEKLYSIIDVKDYNKLSWDLRVSIMDATSEAELEAFLWEINWLEDQFEGRIPPFILDRHLGDLRSMYARKLTTLSVVRM